jgi:hypothetical protein
MLALSMLATIGDRAAAQKESSSPWIATARIIKNGERPGAGVYLNSGLVITAAHLTAIDATMGVNIGGVNLPAKLLKQGTFQDTDLSLLMFDEDKLPAGKVLPRMPLCEAPPWPGDEVIVVDAERAARSHIVSPQMIPPMWRNKFSTLIGDVATTGNSGSGVFDPNRKCLLGIMSRKFLSPTGEGIAKYFVSAAIIRDFMPAEFAPRKQ